MFPYPAITCVNWDEHLLMAGRSWVLIPVEGRHFALFQNVQTGYEVIKQEVLSRK
jgi:hypothetical protein